MKVVIICTLALVALATLVHGEDDFRVHLEDQLDSPYRRLARTRRSEWICEPRSTKTIECNSCFCLEDGSGWGCTQKGCLSFQLEIPDQVNSSPES